MGKIKSAVITALLVAAVALLAFFALFSWQVPGSNGVKRYNSFISNIRLGGDLTGGATTVLFPEGVVSVKDYADLPESDKADYTQKGGVYVKEDKLEIGGKDLKDIVKADAEVLSKRLGEKGYSSYSVSVQDEYTLRVTVPTDFTYAAYKEYDSTARSNATSATSKALQSLAYDGELSLRNSESAVNLGRPYDIVTPSHADVTEYFTGISKYSLGGNHAVKIDLTQKGREQFKTVSELIVNNSDGSDKAISFYVGEHKLLSLNIDAAIDSASFYISVDEADAQNYAIVLNSVAHGKTLELNYDTENIEIVYNTSEMGETAALFLGVAFLLIVVAAIAYSIFRYKKLGLVNAIIILMYSLTMVIATMLLGIQLTLTGAVCAVLGLALLCGANFATFESVRKETAKGKTIQSAVKSGYKNLLAGILEMHIILLVTAIMLALICIGEMSACGLIFVVATVASYALYWFTRFMWYVISSPVKNKFKFCGFKREELIDD